MKYRIAIAQDGANNLIHADDLVGYLTQAIENEIGGEEWEGQVTIKAGSRTHSYYIELWGDGEIRFAIAKEEE